MKQQTALGLLALSPLFLFVGFFLVSALFFGSQISPLFSCIIAIIYSFFTFKEKIGLNKKIEIFLAGNAHPAVIAMCYIFIFSAVLTYILKIIGGIDAAVAIGLYILPHQYLLPGLFLIISLFFFLIGSSMGAIAAFLPVGIGIAHNVGIDAALMAGIVVSGAMIGDNISIISDTTIAATQTTGARMMDKFYANIRLVIPAFIITTIILFFKNQNIAIEPTEIAIAPTIGDCIKIAPYGLVFAGALLGCDVIAVLLLGIFAAMAIGISMGTFNCVEATQLFLKGYAQDASGIHEVLILVLLVAGLSHIVAYNGGIEFLLNQFQTRIKNKAGAEIYISLLVFFVNAAIAINTIAILVTGPLAKKIADNARIEPKRTACLLDLVACICQGILPYAAQLLLAASLAGVSSVAIMPHLHYQWLVLVMTILSIGKTYWENR